MIMPSYCMMSKIHNESPSTENRRSYQMDITALQATCQQIRRDIINMLADAGSGHPGGSLSAVEMLVALYYDVMNLDPQNPQDPKRDRFVLSKGHAAPALYAVLGEKGYFQKNCFCSFRQLHSQLQGHPDMVKCPGVEASTGSLGQGLSIAVGMALAAKTQGNPCKIYAMCGDGSCRKGWYGRRPWPQPTTSWTTLPC